MCAYFAFSLFISLISIPFTISFQCINYSVSLRKHINFHCAWQGNASIFSILQYPPLVCSWASLCQIHWPQKKTGSSNLLLAADWFWSQRFLTGAILVGPTERKHLYIRRTKYKAKLQWEACHFGSLWTGKVTKQHQNCIRRQKDTSNDKKLALERISVTFQQ